MNSLTKPAASRMKDTIASSRFEIRISEKLKQIFRDLGELIKV